ncbi:hypothetical protein CKN99_13690 [Carnobacterium maltaromaticum]|uniref:O-antigen polymerase n=2 Tax=Carnobacterium maltaromaticum TaxID=2751 RepID=UPI0007053D90|nr:hypothetical protein [Carnobacterium maltaromaticum]MDT1943851.1 hypothetical protein [Carnobacterium maltaromaticum]MDT1999231.1 hypothetical protein [Carnobacterium maltaromaticum]TFJ24341.1 hypothetical protein CKN90_13650 [Carnobacterium maltaromaticum]TFJ29747.1 hypothetical protein CKN98_13655 [Carnobacterium maltaromaticum]TFJ32884.1 hypothetical protein CKN88_13610 [Carnobacterium maltaromaticum]
MINPYIIYALSFIGVLIAYMFGWSYLFPELQFSLLAFLLVSIIVAIALGFLLFKSNIIVFKNIPYKKSQVYITFAILIGYLIEGIYSKGFPLLSILFNLNGNDYNEFGIPMFHVLLVTFNSFFSVYLFQVLLSGNKNKRLISLLVLINLVPSLLIANRGMLTIIMMGFLFIFLIKNQKKITLKLVLFVAVCLVAGGYIFGVSGNIRVNNTYQTGAPATNGDMFMLIGGATDEFKESPIPKEFFWVYIYGASPLANFQKTIKDYQPGRDINFNDLFIFLVTQIAPDFISKRVESSMNIKVDELSLITPELNVGTSFIVAYVILGWPGVVLFTLILFTGALGYIWLLKRLTSTYFLSGLVILNTLFLMNTFSNMLSFSGLSFQLVYPILLGLLEKHKQKKSVVNIK